MDTGHPHGALNYNDVSGEHRSGKRVTRMMLTGREGGPDNFRFEYSGGEENETWTTPRHRHCWEQIRHPIKGSYEIGKNEVLPEGWVCYFPESTYYGPQNLNPHFSMVQVQFGGVSGNGLASVRQRRAAFDALLARGGKFEDGVYTWYDENGRRHNKDSAEAIWEQCYGRKMEYPKQRYRDIILMNPATFNWAKDPEAAGVAYKRLGTFTEREIKIAFIQMERGAKLTFGTEKAQELMFLKQGSLSQNGQSYPVLTAFGSKPKDTPSTLTAVEASELFYIKLPTFEQEGCGAAGPLPLPQ